VLNGYFIFSSNLDIGLLNWRTFTMSALRELDSFLLPDPHCEYEMRESLPNVLKQDRINQEIWRLDDMQGQDLEGLVSDFSTSLDGFDLTHDVLFADLKVLRQQVKNEFMAYKHDLARKTVERKYYGK